MCHILHIYDDMIIAFGYAVENDVKNLFLPACFNPASLGQTLSSEGMKEWGFTSLLTAYVITRRDRNLEPFSSQIVPRAFFSCRMAIHSPPQRHTCIYSDQAKWISGSNRATHLETHAWEPSIITTRPSGSPVECPRQVRRPSHLNPITEIVQLGLITDFTHLPVILKNIYQLLGKRDIHLTACMFTPCHTWPSTKKCT